MSTNFYFNNFPINQITSEQLLVEDLVIEAMQINGMDVYYLPRSSRDQVDMLYGEDTLKQYTEAYQITGDNCFASAAKDVLNYVNRVLLHKEGGFYSAEDAESVLDASDLLKKEEGAFYVWRKSENLKGVRCLCNSGS